MSHLIVLLAIQELEFLMECFCGGVLRDVNLTKFLQCCLSLCFLYVIKVFIRVNAKQSYERYLSCTDIIVLFDNSEVCWIQTVLCISGLDCFLFNTAFRSCSFCLCKGNGRCIGMDILPP